MAINFQLQSLLHFYPHNFKIIITKVTEFL